MSNSSTNIGKVAPSNRGDGSSPMTVVASVLVVTREKVKVFWSVVVPDAVNVVNNLVPRKLPLDGGFYNQDVLSNIAAFISSWMLWLKNEYVAKSFVTPTLPVGVTTTPRSAREHVFSSVSPKSFGTLPEKLNPLWRCPPARFPLSPALGAFLRAERLFPKHARRTGNFLATVIAALTDASCSVFRQTGNRTESGSSTARSEWLPTGFTLLHGFSRLSPFTA